MHQELWMENQGTRRTQEGPVTSTGWGARKPSQNGDIWSEATDGGMEGQTSGGGGGKIVSLRSECVQKLVNKGWEGGSWWWFFWAHLPIGHELSITILRRHWMDRCVGVPSGIFKQPHTPETNMGTCPSHVQLLHAEWTAIRYPATSPLNVWAD